MLFKSFGRVRYFGGRFKKLFCGDLWNGIMEEVYSSANYHMPGSVDLIEMIGR